MDLLSSSRTRTGRSDTSVIGRGRPQRIALIPEHDGRFAGAGGFQRTVRTKRLLAASCVRALTLACRLGLPLPA